MKDLIIGYAKALMLCFGMIFGIFVTGSIDEKLFGGGHYYLTVIFALTVIFLYVRNSFKRSYAEYRKTLHYNVPVIGNNHIKFRIRQVVTIIATLLFLFVGAPIIVNFNNSASIRISTLLIFWVPALIMLYRDRQEDRFKTCFICGILLIVITLFTAI